MSSQITTFYQLLQRYCRMEPRRELRAREIQAKGWVHLGACTSTRLQAQVSVNYDVEIVVQAGGPHLHCSCPDFQKRGVIRNQPCKHILALALEADVVHKVQPGAPADLSDLPAEQNARPDLPDFETDGSFTDQVRDAITSAIVKLADLVQAVLITGEIPFLIGPTGVGKTSAVRLVATRNEWGFEEVTGSESFADADIVGLRTDHMEQPGIFARAFRRARRGETVLLFIDEATRFNARAHDLLMRPFQATPATVARAMGISAPEPVRLVEAPLWGIEWAPVSRVHLAVAGNPWGTSLDPALVRRVWPVFVEPDEAILRLFDATLADAVRASWNAVRQGELPLPIEYQALAQAVNPADTRILRSYLVRLSAVDKAAAEGFRTILEGMGITTAGGS